MDPTLHQKMGVNHLNRVLGYAPFVAKEGRAEVHLTSEDWWVVADTLFNMNTPREILPVAIQEFRLLDDQQAIEIKTQDCVISVEMM